jgi:glycosyltransferase involved in cell wall biosynthesis
MSAKKKIIMLGTGLDTMGGISAVVNVYRAAGLFARFPILHIATHCDGGSVKKLKTVLLALLRFVPLLLTGQVALVHIHVASRASFWRKSVFFLVAFLFRVPTILHLHGGGFQVFFEQECGTLGQRFVRYIYNKSSRVVVLSGKWKTWVQSISVNPHVVAIYNPVQMPATAFAWDDRRAGEVLFLGKMGKLKGSYDLLDAVATVRTLQPDLHLMLGGDGEQERVQQRANELGIAAQVQLLGWIQGADKERVLAQSMLYVLPSYHEGLPMSILEAMAAGMPILSTVVGGIPEAVTDGVEGFLIEAGDVAALADRMQRILADPLLARRMGEAARRKVETTFSSQAVLPHIERLYMDLGVGRIESKLLF